MILHSEVCDDTILLWLYADRALEAWTSQMSTVLESPVAGLNIYQNEPGPITFGYLDTTQYVGDLTWVDIDTTTGSAWVASTVYYFINGTSTFASAGLPALMGKQRLYTLISHALTDGRLCNL